MEKAVNIDDQGVAVALRSLRRLAKIACKPRHLTDALERVRHETMILPCWPFTEIILCQLLPGWIQLTTNTEDLIRFTSNQCPNLVDLTVHNSNWTWNLPIWSDVDLWSTFKHVTSLTLSSVSGRELLNVVLASSIGVQLKSLTVDNERPYDFFHPDNRHFGAEGQIDLKKLLR